MVVVGGMTQGTPATDTRAVAHFVALSGQPVAGLRRLAVFVTPAHLGHLATALPVWVAVQTDGTATLVAAGQVVADGAQGTRASALQALVDV